MAAVFVTEAVRNNNLEIAQLLLDSGCDINLADRTQQAPIHEAIRQGQNSELISLCVYISVPLSMSVCLSVCLSLDLSLDHFV